jgi:branched-chain amino acid transport system substrate-binding protein
MREWRAFMTKFFPDGDTKDIRNVFAYGASLTMLQVLKQCGNDFSRKNILRQSLSLRNLNCPVLLPGIQISTSPTNYHPVRQFQITRWTGKSWDAVGDVIEGS